MFKKFASYYGNLKISNKLSLGFALLLAMIILSNIATAAIQMILIDPARESSKKANDEMMLGQALGFNFSLGRSFEGSIIPSYLAYGYEGVTNLYANHMPYLDESLNKLSDLEAKQAQKQDPEKITALGEIRQLITDYRIFTSDLQSGMIERGDISLGLGGDIIALLNRVNESIDASTAINYATNYITKFDIQSGLFFPQSLTELEVAVEASDLPDSQRQELVELVHQSNAAFQNLLTLDARLIQGFTDLDSVGTPVSAAVDAMVEGKVQEQREAEQRLNHAERIQLFLSMVILAIAILVGLTVAYFTGRLISQPVMELTTISQQIAKGDYSQHATIYHSDEIGQLAQSFNSMIDTVAQRETELVHQAEKLRVATASAKEAARLKSEFLANMSHELRTPLNAIIGYSDMLLMGMTGSLNDNQHHKIERLRENGTRLLTLINDILDLTRIEARRVDIIAKPFDLRPLIRRLASQVEVLAQDKGLDFEVDVASDVPEKITGDEKRLEQIIVNLLSNAFKFTSQGKVALKVWTTGQIWQIAVSDTGIGIPPHARSLIFEEFRQLDGSSNRVYKGTGLGLAITRNLVRLMDGQITVDSELGQGSTFTVTFPLVQPEQDSQILGQSQSAPELVETSNV